MHPYAAVPIAFEKVRQIGLNVFTILHRSDDTRLWILGELGEENGGPHGLSNGLLKDLASDIKHYRRGSAAEGR